MFVRISDAESDGIRTRWVHSAISFLTLKLVRTLATTKPLPTLSYVQQAVVQFGLARDHKYNVSESARKH